MNIITHKSIKKKTPEVKKGHLNIPLYNTVVWQQVFFSLLILKKPRRNTQLGQMCASLSSCQEEEFHSCDWIINTKHGFKKNLPEQNTLPNAPFKKIIRASEVKVVGATFPVFFLLYYSPGGPLWTHLDVYVTSLGNKGQNLVHTRKHLITLHFLQKIWEKAGDWILLLVALHPSTPLSFLPLGGSWSLIGVQSLHYVLRAGFE